MEPEVPSAPIEPAHHEPGFLRGYNLIDMSRHAHHPEHHLKKHIYYPMAGEELTHENLMEHIGHHETPEGHRLSIHHNEGGMNFYDQTFDSHEAAQHHVKSYFKFADMFPNTTKFAKDTYNTVTNADYGKMFDKYGKLIAAGAAIAGYPEVGGGIALAHDIYREGKDIINGGKKIYDDLINDLYNIPYVVFDEFVNGLVGR
jgi:hypothetical protein